MSLIQQTVEAGAFKQVFVRNRDKESEVRKYRALKMYYTLFSLFSFLESYFILIFRLAPVYLPTFAKFSMSILLKKKLDLYANFVEMPDISGSKRAKISNCTNYYI